MNTTSTKLLITKKINYFCEKFNLDIDVDSFVENITSKLPDSTVYDSNLNLFIAEVCDGKSLVDPQFNKLSSAFVVSNIHENNKLNFIEVTQKLFNYGLLNKKYHDFVIKHSKVILETINYEKDYSFSYFAIQTLHNSYLMGIYENDTTFKQIEKPQDLWMRVAIGMYYVANNIEMALKCYEYLSSGLFIQASPTLYNSGSCHEQLASCFLLNMNDSIEGIYKTIKDSAFINKWAGGVGFTISRIRSAGSIIKGTNGKSSGIVPLARTLNESVKLINQGGKRNGAIALYLEPWHSDIFDFCDLKRQDGNIENRARELFYGLWINDLFMERVKNGKLWSLMCPDKCPGLVDVYGDKFKELYEKYEKEGKYVKQVKAIEVWDKILSSQQQTGVPYLMFKDHCNKKSNQKNIGTIQSSNLCTEIVQYSDSNNYGVCNLASICLPKFVFFKDGKPYFDYKKLEYISGVLVQNINNIIDITYYPVIEAKNSNVDLRPIGIGIQGLADVFCLFDTPFGSDLSRELNKRIFETIYFGCLTKSVELSKKDGPYKLFEGSPFSQGKLQFHLWGLTVNDLVTKDELDWNTLIENVKTYGVRNSLLTTCMPTASTSHIMGNTECIEPHIRNVYIKSTITGNFNVVNTHLVNKLISLKLWNDDIREKIRFYDGSIQKINEIPDKVKLVYRTAYEIPTKTILQLSIERAPFIDQSQSLNIFFPELNKEKLSSSHFYAWSSGLKTAMYYLRVKSPVSALLFNISANKVKKLKEEEGKVCPIRRKNNDEICESCQ